MTPSAKWFAASLLAGVSALAVANPVYAADTATEAKVKKLEREIETLTREMHELKDSMSQQSAAASQQAAEEQKRHEDEQARLHDLEVQHAEAQSAPPQPAPASGWWNDTKISGRMYYDLTSLDSTSKAAGKSKVDSTSNGTSFDIKRFYVGIDHKFNDTFAANITTDFTFDSGTGTTQLFIKKAYLDANLSPMLDVRLGSADLPWIPFVEGIYGYRYVENVITDRTKFGTSADWGVHLQGKFADGLLNYALSVVNGSGFKKPGLGFGTNRTQQMDFEGRVNANWQGFTLAVGGYVGKLGVKHGTHAFHTATRFDALAAYKAGPITAGFEYFNTHNFFNVTKAAGDKAEGYGGFASYEFIPNWKVFGRYDYVQPNRDSNSALKDRYFNVGISYSPWKLVDFALVYKHENANKGFISTSNGTQGGTDSGNYNEVGLWGNFQW